MVFLPAAAFGQARFLLAATTAAVLAATACSADVDAQGGEETQAAELNEKKSLGMTDVTLLFPLPKSVDFVDDMLSAGSELEQGELLPADVFAQLLPLPAPKMFDFDGKERDPQKPLFEPWVDALAYLRVVGVRLDPCFGESSNMGAVSCENTIRLTAQFFQPRSVAGGNVVIDGRSAIHLFYSVSRADFTALAKKMLELRKTSGLPLQKSLLTTTQGVHPTMAAEGLRGPYASALKDIILSYAGEKTLTQVAFCVQDRGNDSSSGYGQGRTSDNRWVFGRFAHERGRLKPLDISTLDYTGLQSVDTMTSRRQLQPVIVTPATRTRDDFFPVFNPQREADGTVSQEKQLVAHRAAITLQNPTKYTATSTDCVSCHMAKQAAPNHGADPAEFRSSTYRLDHTHDLVGPFRMFGYDSSHNPIVAARVVNETAVVLDYLNKYVMR